MSYEERFIHFLHTLGIHRKQQPGNHAPVHYSDHSSLHEVYQASTINALLEGVYEGETTYEALKEHGDFGLGTFDALDGEMIAFDNEFYQIKSDGVAYPVADSQKTPFATVLEFRPDFHETIEDPMDFARLQQHLDDIIDSPNIFYAVRIDGQFERVKTRSVPKQEKPYPPLAKVVENQPTFLLEDVKGTIAGFRFPDFAQGFNVPGYHLHFLTSDKKAGGHVLDLRMTHADIAIDHTSGFHIELPEHGDFLKADLDGDHGSDLQKDENK